MSGNGFNLPGLGGTRPVADQRDERVTRATDNPMLGTADSRLVNNPPPRISGASASLQAAPSFDDSPKELTPENAIADEFRNQQLANQGVSAADGVTMYSSHPIANYQVGRFKFVKGLLKLDSADAESFEKLLATLPATERSRIAKIDVSAAEAIVKGRLAAQGRATKDFDSTTGERTGRLPIGTGDLADPQIGHAMQAQEDSNKPDAHALEHGADVIATEGQSDNG